MIAPPLPGFMLDSLELSASLFPILFLLQSVDDQMDISVVKKLLQSWLSYIFKLFILTRSVYSFIQYSCSLRQDIISTRDLHLESIKSVGVFAEEGDRKTGAMIPKAEVGNGRLHKSQETQTSLFLHLSGDLDISTVTLTKISISPSQHACCGCRVPFNFLGNPVGFPAHTPLLDKGF
jgi:hypothetical protein